MGAAFARMDHSGLGANVAIAPTGGKRFYDWLYLLGAGKFPLPPGGGPAARSVSAEIPAAEQGIAHGGAANPRRRSGAADRHRRADMHNGNVTISPPRRAMATGAASRPRRANLMLF